MRKPVQVIFQSLVGACAGMTAGVILIGILGALTGIPYILSHAGPKNDPVTMFLAHTVMYGLYMGLPAGAPIGGLIGLVAGGIRGLRSGTSTVRKIAIHIDDFDTAQAPAKSVISTKAPSSSRSCSFVVVIAMAIPGAIILAWLINGWREGAKFDRFSSEVTRLGGRAENADFEGWSNTVEAINVDLSSTATDDDDLERLIRDKMFHRVHSLSLSGTRITDRGAAMLDACPWFNHLDLSHTSVTDRGLASMSQCCAHTLKLSGTRITDATLQLIEQQAERFPNRSIDLTDTKVTEERVRELGKFQSMMSITYGSIKSPKHTR
ncbi:Leucine Rich repeat-containing protein [Singulisphaera sp. GP187]|uniref:hypothetical protein n=1 Tax=Singulisphaera sp. GP187 TaxID=1882752 RepID=UPI000926A5EF|nr:hypothetical protein [Singulisphaera sp. GP187]SIO66276.1 Leucine Rich repeat-containing protein [Singulisphaera sp. GP187]